MADEADIAKANEDLILERRIDAVRLAAREPTGGFGDCVDCNEPIPAARLAANPNARRCIACQEDYEEMNG
jgi:DnaK suppressor protein